MLNTLKSNIANAFTLGNLICGVFAIYATFQYDFQFAGILILIGGAFDFLDGLVARLLKVQSDLGAQLDSLSDLVTFGVAPGILAYHLFEAAFVLDVNKVHQAILLQDLWTSESNFVEFNAMLIEGFKSDIPEKSLLIGKIVFFGFLPAMGAYRLAKFNVSTEQSDSFRGTPIPWTGIYFAAAGIVYHYAFTNHLTYNGELMYLNQYGLLVAGILIGILMVSNVKLLAFKFKNLKWKENSTKFLFLIGSLITLILFPLVAVPIILNLYIIFSIIEYYILKR